MTPPPLSSTPAPVFNLRRLEAILDLALASPGEIHVVVAPPGAGKSTGLRKLLAPRVNAAPHPLARVLWAAHDIHAETSLGREAWEDFDRLGVNSAILQRREQLALLSPPPSFEDQFDWPTDPQVKVVSHARVRQIFGQGHALAPRLAGADLLVIDEDPFRSLTVNSSSTLTPNASTKSLAATGDPVGVALQQLAELVALIGGSETYRNFRRRTTGDALSGHLFWTNFFLFHSGPVDISALAASLRSLGFGSPDQIAEAFAHDAALARLDPDNPPRRFGLDWNGPEMKEPYLRFDLLLPLTFDLPVVVLDGYANEQLYRALFPGHTVHLHHFHPGRKLEIECAPQLKLNEVSEGTKYQRQNRVQIAEELARFYEEAQGSSSPRPMLVLSSLRLRDESSEWKSFLQDAFERRGLDQSQLFYGHWHTGRGRNTHAGAHVFALHRPYLNQRFSDHTLTALFPQDEEARLQMKAYLEGAEALQMLHRGRQATSTSDPSDRPRVLLALDEGKTRALLDPFRDRIALRPYQSELQFTRKSQNPRWRDAMTELALDLLRIFPSGLPRALLQALPIHKGTGKRKQQVYERLTALAADLGPDSPLHQAMCAPDQWAYTDVRPGGTGNGSKIEKEAMEAAGLSKAKVTGNVQGSQIYYLPDPALAEKAQQDFEHWLAAGERPAHPAERAAGTPEAPPTGVSTTHPQPADPLLTGLAALRRSRTP
ncbi:hypothetical protein [Deinococcus sp. UYEF24]